MKKPINIPSLKKLWVCACFGLAISAQAQTFNYNVGDLLIAFRQTTGGSSDLLVNAGPVSGYTNLAAGTKITISALTGSLLSSAFGSANGLSWSASGCFDVSAPVAAEQNTLFMTKPRASLHTQTTPLQRNSTFGQGVTVSYVKGAGAGGVTIGSTLGSGPENNSTVLIESESANAAGASSYYVNLGTALNWHGSSLYPEQVTSGSFSSGSLPVRSDLYWLPPGSGNGTYLGYFELSPAGVLSYTAGPSPISSRITQITRVGTVNTVTFTTGTAGNYTLLGADAPNGPWTTVGTAGNPVAGNGVNHSLTETTPGATRYYRISAQ